MPELPEVETIRKGLLKNVLNKKIVNIEITKDFEKKIRPSSSLVIKKIKGGNFSDIDRIGKLLVFFVGSEFLLIHLKMTGQLVFQNREKSKAIGWGHPFKEQLFLPNKFTKVVISFFDGSQLFFNDIRKFGYFDLVDYEGLEIIKKKYGVEPIKKEFTKDFFYQALKKKERTKIKSFLLDQKIILGLGNIYADEVCFSSGVKPTRLIKTLSKTEKDKLFTNCREILLLAIKNKGTTFSDYRTVKGGKGNFQNYLKVYGRYGQSCFSCQEKIKKTKVAGRTSSYCDKCQK